MSSITRIAFGFGVLMGAGLGIPFGGQLVATAQAAPVVQEDDPAWDCRLMGDAVCGPTNAQGVDAGLYRDGQLVAAWDPAWFGHPELVPAL